MANNTHDEVEDEELSEEEIARRLPQLRRTVATVAGLNFGYFWIEIAVAIVIGSVALFADSVDFLEDAAVNLLILLALGWSLRARARAGKVLAAIILLPAVAAAWSLIVKVGEPDAPDVLSLVVTAGGAIVVNGFCAYLLARYKDEGGSLAKGAFLTARNDVIVNALIIVMAIITHFTASGWPDIVLGAVIIVINVGAAKEVWEAAVEETLAAEALRGEFDEE